MSTTRTATLSIRIEPQAKSEAEKVFHALGISMSDAINVFFKQVAYRHAIPFELEVPYVPTDLDATNWSKEKLTSEIQKGISSAKEETTYASDEVFDMLK